ncbi:MAG TPA: tRNA (cytidine(34)-2'-O)-methyltransferase [Burkholderiales bacterium]|jgi:tRNA (cytidine/uridine-2'-O-)-methyltransferase|nr:tRNA (cytidine(34)-2'-O)-methyltransferase [Burkholderiales bacterium]
MLHIVLYEPEIPPNTGNVIRLAANTGAQLHLVEPLGFTLEDAQLKRAGLDYHEYASLQVHANWADCAKVLEGKRLFALSTRNSRVYSAIEFRDEDVFVFGPETRGLPVELLATFANEHRLRIPMRPNNRSLNLSNAVAVVVLEAWRQLGFAGGA